MTKAILLILAFGAIVSLVRAQPMNIDSLRQAALDMPDGTDKVDALNRLIYELSYGDKTEAHQRAEQSMALATALGYEEGVANVHDLLGIIYLDKGSLDSAEHYLLFAMKYYDTHGLKRKLFTSYQKIGQVHSQRNSFDQARYYYEKKFEIAEELDDAQLLGNANNDYAAFFINQGWNRLDNENDSTTYLEFFEKAIPYIHKAITYFEDADYNKGIALAYGNLSILTEEMGDLDAALTNIFRATEYFEKMGYKIYMASAYNQTNRIYQKKENYDSAFFYLDRCLEIALEVESKFDIRNSYGQYAYLYQRLGDFEKALEYHQNYDDINHQILAENKQALIDELEVKYKSEKSEQDLLIQEAENKNQRAVIAMVVAVGLILFVVAIIFWLKNKKEKRLNAELEESNRLVNEQNAQLKEAYHEQNNLMAVVAHDLRAPLNNVKGLTEIMNLAGPVNDTQLEISKKTDQVVESGLELISDILSLSRFQNGIVAEIEALELNALMENICDIHASYSRRKNIAIRFDPLEGESIIHTDKTFFTRIMDNLISNAIKFSAFDSVVELECSINEDTVLVRVKDEGPGMTEEDLKSAFKKFTRLSAKPTGGENSNGIGLSIVKTLVSKLDGKIKIDTTVGVGTTFEVSLPNRIEK